MTLNRKYNEAMEHIEVTPEMRSRILDNIENMDFAEKEAGRDCSFSKYKTLRYACGLPCCYACRNFGLA